MLLKGLEPMMPRSEGDGWTMAGRL